MMLSWIISDIQSDIVRLKSDIYLKVESHEVSSLSSRINTLENTVWQLSTNFDALQHRCEENERRIQELECLVEATP